MTDLNHGKKHNIKDYQKPFPIPETQQITNKITDFYIIMRLYIIPNMTY